MTYSSLARAASTTDSTDRCAALSTSRPSPSAHQPKAPASRMGSTAKRFLDALMRSMSAPYA